MTRSRRAERAEKEEKKGIVMHIGSFNALLNVLMGLTHAFLFVVLQNIYAIFTARDLRLYSATEATDTGEIDLVNWFFRRRSYSRANLRRLKKWRTGWWAALLILYCTALLPAELLVETGIHLRKDCSPIRKNSTGICARRWHGNRDVYVSSTSMLTASALWIDPEWQTLLEGASKVPVLQEVRTDEALKPGRRVVLTGCTIEVSRCSSQSECGKLEIRQSPGAYQMVVQSSSYINRSVPAGEYSNGDVTFDGSMGFAFIFASLKESPRKRSDSRQTISVTGIETLLLPRESRRVQRRESRPWMLTAAPARSRLYSISCATDGMLSDDLAHALSIYRAMQLEQPGRERSDVGSNLSRVSPITVDDVVRSAYSLLSDDVTAMCKGSVDLYTTCGYFQWKEGVPFAVMTLVLTLVWLLLRRFVGESGGEFVPCDTMAWRGIAHMQARAVECYLKKRRGKEGSGLSRESSVEDDEVNRFFGGPPNTLSYSRRKYPTTIADSQDGIQGSGLV